MIAGQTQWGLPFADMVAYSINTEGMGGRPASAGMNAFGFPWCPFGRAPDVELMENEFPILIPLSQHWTDSCGAGKHRGGVGTVQPWVAHQAPMVLLMCIADNSKLQTPQPLFGGYAPCTVPGIGIRAPGLMDALKRGDDIDLDFRSIIEGRTIGGQWEVEFMGRSIRPYDEGDVMGFCFSAGGAGYGDPLEADPEDVAQRLRRRPDQRVDDARDLQGRLRRGRGDRAGRRDRGGCAPPSARRGRARDADWETFDAVLVAALAARGPARLVRLLARGQPDGAGHADVSALEAALAGRPVDRPLLAPLFAALAAEVEELDVDTFLADPGRRARIYADLARSLRARRADRRRGRRARRWSPTCCGGSAPSCPTELGVRDPGPGDARRASRPVLAAARSRGGGRRARDLRARGRRDARRYARAPRRCGAR